MLGLNYHYENRGIIQYVEEERIGYSIHYFLSLLEDRPGLMITRRHPNSLRMDFDVPDIEQYWLSMNFMTRDVISPNNLPRLNNVITGFLEKNPGGVIYLEGLEYLVTQNNEKTVIRFLQYLRDKVVQTNGLLVISMDPLAYPLKEVHLMRREGSVMDLDMIEEIIEGVGIKVHRARI